jgi:iron complex transport system substrate-binding protein
MASRNATLGLRLNISVRIVSLLSSATEIVHLLGLQESLVGISHECDFPPGVLDRPRVSRVRFDLTGLDSAGIDAAVRGAMEHSGSVYEIDAERLRELQPDLVLTQAVCEVCAVPTGSVREVVDILPDPPRVVSLDAHTIAGILSTIQQVADAAGEPARGEAAVRGLTTRLRRVAEAVAGRLRSRVLMLEWLDPPFLPGHWVPEMVEAAGGLCLAGVAGHRSREADWEELTGHDPDVLLVEPCGYDLAQALADGRRSLDRLSAIAPRAAEEGQAWALDSALFSRSGPRIVAGVEALAALLHPDLFPNCWTDGVAARLL